MIEKIEIQYFRSIYRATLKNINGLNVFAGKNDVGKSNVLRALNLYFNNFISIDGDYSFLENYNYKRLEEVRKETVKGKQFIQIKVTFSRGNSSIKTLPERFTVTKKWNRDSIEPIVTDDVEARLKKERKKYNDRVKSSVTRFMNNIRYIYVPAIKDEKIFARVLAGLSDTVFEKKLGNDISLLDSMNEVATQVSGATQALSDEFYKVTSVESSIQTPTNIGQLYKAISIITKSGENKVLLKNRGDGIQVRYLPSIINYIALNSSERFIWGFEEPENSLEFNLARRMAEDFYNEYRKHSQIFVTTHSPAFIDLGNRSFSSGYRCFSKDSCTMVTQFNDEDDEALLSEELGYARILQRQYEEFKIKSQAIEQSLLEIKKLEEKLSQIKKPTVFTEGKTDALILKEAWNKLYPDRVCPFEVLSCSLTDEIQENAGCDVLATILKGVRYDSDKIVIGLFDNDAAGIDSYKLDSNYKENKLLDCKVNKNKKGYALLLPASTDELKRIADHKALCIEFLFSHDNLLKSVDGKCLKIEAAQGHMIINNIRIETKEYPEYWYLGKINKDTKMGFAERVVPTFEKDSFVNFTELFKRIEDIISFASSEE